MNTYMSKQTFIYLPSKEGQQWVAGPIEPGCITEPYSHNYNCDEWWKYEEDLEAYNDFIASLKSYLFEGPPGKPGEEVEGELRKIRIARGVGYKLEGDPTIYKAEQDEQGYFYWVVRAIQPAKPDCSQHPKDLFGHSDMKEVAEVIGNLHYETFDTLLDHLAVKLTCDGQKDFESDRKKLGVALQNTSLYIQKARAYLEEAWEISKPHMKQQ